jgi:predicted molibdopterin-dependent oxidoreductase YjgC
MKGNKMFKADRIVHTTCPYCGVGCQINLHIKDEQIFRVDGRYDNDVNVGNLCVKGRFGYDFVHAPDRLQRPLMRNGRHQPLIPAEWWGVLVAMAAVASLILNLLYLSPWVILPILIDLFLLWGIFVPHWSVASLHGA